MTTSQPLSDASLQPPPVLLQPGAAFAPGNQLFMGIPGIACAPGGRLWACWYSGGEDEGITNHVVLVTSDDGGASWSPPVLAIDPPGAVRAYDPAIWLDPHGTLWLFWAQSEEWWDGRSGTFAITTADPDSAAPTWTPPRRLCDGITMNKPTVLANGDWLLPAAVWNRKPFVPAMDADRFSNVYVSSDQGATWQRRGGADVPERVFDEHMTVELGDGRLWMLVRTSYGIGESFSDDQGRTWSPGQPSSIAGPNSRFHIQRLASGRLLLVNHHNFTSRSHMTAMLSEDDGKTWKGFLLLDERRSVSYPDAAQGRDGRIWIIYDFERYWSKEILLASVTEDDILAGRCVDAASRLNVLVGKGSAQLSDHAKALLEKRQAALARQAAKQGG